MKAQPRRRSRRREMTVHTALMRVWDEMLVQRIEKKLTPDEVIWILARLTQREAARVARLAGADREARR